MQMSSTSPLETGPFATQWTRCVCSSSNAPTTAERDMRTWVHTVALDMSERKHCNTPFKMHSLKCVSMRFFREKPHDMVVLHIMNSKEQTTDNTSQQWNKFVACLVAVVQSQMNVTVYINLPQTSIKPGHMDCKAFWRPLFPYQNLLRGKWCLSM